MNIVNDLFFSLKLSGQIVLNPLFKHIILPGTEGGICSEPSFRIPRNDDFTSSYNRIDAGARLLELDNSGLWK